MSLSRMRLIPRRYDPSYLTRGMILWDENCDVVLSLLCLPGDARVYEWVGRQDGGNIR